ncbi:MAG: type II secretion system inner membrane protein GspF, partial [Candidatus Firestonebacteria bacterium]|nr:type II secretion system inner membrane protein GspF [Candidatus Firestonebacteria bacterium]
MPVFEYKALDISGKQVHGIIEADSPEDARNKLRKSNLYTTDIRSSNKGFSKEISFPKIFKIKGSSELSLITRQLATLIGAGLPLIQSLNIIEEQIDDKNIKKIIIQVRERITHGLTFADALAEHPKFFDTIYVNMVRAGENSGALEVVLTRLADFTEKQVRLKNKIQSILYYPMFMAIVGTGVLFFLLSYVVPKVTYIFIETKRALPFATRFLLGLSDILRQYWWLVAIIIAGIIIFIKQYTRTEKGAILIDNIKLRIPIFGGLLHEIIIARFCRTLGTLISSGVPILRAMEVAEKVTDNKVISASIEKSRTSITAGDNVSGPLKKSGLFPPLVTHMIAVGEQSGQLEEMLNKIADTYDIEVEISVNALTSFLEPFMIVVMGVIVGFIILAILLP